MVSEHSVSIEGQAYPITISDECKALSDAKASGRAILGMWSSELAEGFCQADYIIENLTQVNERLLERVVRRHLKLPWVIAETPWMIIREFVSKDAAVIRNWGESEGVAADFRDEEAITRYSENQYAFYEYGIWAVTLRDGGELIGMAGISNQELPDGKTIQELGYHIMSSYRKKGYAKEACEAVMEYAKEELSLQTLYIRTDASNEASVQLAASLGFEVIQTYNESGRCLSLYERNLP